MLAVVNLSKTDARRYAEHVAAVDERCGKAEFIEAMPDNHLMNLTFDFASTADEIRAAGLRAFHFGMLMLKPTTVCSACRLDIIRLSNALRYLSNNLAALATADVTKNPNPEGVNGRRR